MESQNQNHSAKNISPIRGIRDEGKVLKLLIPEKNLWQNCPKVKLSDVWLKVTDVKVIDTFLQRIGLPSIN